MGGSRRANRPANPAAQATQPAQAAPMGTAGEMGYSEGEEAMSAQAAIGLPDNRTPAIQGPSGPVATATPGPPVDALDAARAYTPNVMSLNAPDDMPTMELMVGAERRKRSESALAKRRQEAATIKMFESLVDLNPNNPDYEGVLQTLYMRTGRYV